jgi:drug/metabolite transporter (DMT)-like permease
VGQPPFRDLAPTNSAPISEPFRQTIRHCLPGASRDSSRLKRLATSYGASTLMPADMDRVTVRTAQGLGKLDSWIPPQVRTGHAAAMASPFAIRPAGVARPVLTDGTAPAEQPSSIKVDVTSSTSAEPPASDPPARQEKIPLAIFYMVSAGAIFSFSSAASKWLVATYPVGEVLFTRVFVSLILFASFVLSTAGVTVFYTKRLRAHLLRSMSQFTSQSLLLIAFSMMPLASATAINFSAPLFATLASLVFLKEPVGPPRWMALIVGFLGVLIVTNPGSETFQIGALFALGNALLFGTVTAGVRGMTQTESAKTLTMYQLLLLTIFYGATLPFAFIVPKWSDLPLIFANGVTNMLGQYWWTRSIHLAPTSAVVPFQYLSLLWAMIFGFALWGDVPTASLLVGSAIVVGSGLFLLWHESRRKVAV